MPTMMKLISMLVYASFVFSPPALFAGEPKEELRRKELENVARDLRTAVESKDYDRYQALTLATKKPVSRDEWGKRLEKAEWKKYYTSYFVNPEKAVFLKLSELPPYSFYYYRTETSGDTGTKILQVTVFKREGDRWRISPKIMTYAWPRNKEVTQAEMLEILSKDAGFKMENLIP